jgi:hypothetical protein
VEIEEMVSSAIEVVLEVKGWGLLLHQMTQGSIVVVGGAAVVVPPPVVYLEAHQLEQMPGLQQLLALAR